VIAASGRQIALPGGHDAQEVQAHRKRERFRQQLFLQTDGALEVGTGGGRVALPRCGVPKHHQRVRNRQGIGHQPFLDRQPSLKVPPGGTQVALVLEHGREGEEALGYLGRVGRHPLPDSECALVIVA
jgi:hypothetical protein